MLALEIDTDGTAVLLNAFSFPKWEGLYFGFSVEYLILFRDSSRTENNQWNDETSIGLAANA